MILFLVLKIHFLIPGNMDTVQVSTLFYSITLCCLLGVVERDVVEQGSVLTVESIVDKRGLP